MSRKWSVEDVAYKVESEGLDYMIMHYIGPDSIEDEELKKLWREAEEVLGKINVILSPYLEEIE